MKHDRILEIKRLLLEEREINNLDLCNRLGISLATVRRYLDQLEREGLIRRVYGGAILSGVAPISPLSASQVATWDIRKTKNFAEKQKIARAAIDLIPDNCTLFIDTSTSAFELSKLLVQRKNLTILTNSLRVAALLCSNESLQVYCLGGHVLPDKLSSHGIMAAESLSLGPHIDICICSPGGFSPSRGLRDFVMEMLLIKRTAIERSSSVIALIDHSKFSVQASAFLCPTQRISTIVTDDKVPPEDLQRLKEMNVHTIIAT